MNTPCQATMWANEYASRPDWTDAEHAEAESRAIHNVLEVRIGSAEDGRQVVSEALSEDESFLAYVANSITAFEQSGMPIDEMEIGRQVVAIVRDYAVQVAERRGGL